MRTRQNQTYIILYFIMYIISPSLRRFEESRTNASYVIRHCTVRHFCSLHCIYMRVSASVCVCMCACVCDILLCYKLFPVGVKITTVAFGSIQHLSVSVSICATTSSPAVSILFFTINYNGTYFLRYY